MSATTTGTLPTPRQLVELSRRGYTSGLLNALWDLEEAGDYSPSMNRALLVCVGRHTDLEVSSRAKLARFAMLLRAGKIDAAVLCAIGLLATAKSLHRMGRLVDARHPSDALERMLEHLDGDYTRSDALTNLVESATEGPPDVAKYALALIRRSGFATAACRHTMLKRSKDPTLADWHRDDLIKTLMALERAKIDHVSHINAE